jgi:hypothetical protein
MRRDAATLSTHNLPASMSRGGMRGSGALAKATAWALAAWVAIGFSPPATAQTGDKAVSRVRMFPAGIDAHQAAKAGNTVRIDGSYKVLSDGKNGRELARIPANPQTAYTQAFEQSEGSAWTGTISATRTDPRACGSSYISIRDASQKDMYQFKTGFTVDGNTANFMWQVEIEASRIHNYTYSQEFSGPLAHGKTWTSNWQNDYSGLTRYLSEDGIVKVRHFARVTAAKVLLTDGRLCIAGHPVASALVQ